MSLLEEGRFIVPPKELTIVGTGPSKSFVQKMNELRGQEGVAPFFLRGEERTDMLFLTDNANRFADRVRQDGPVDILPGVWSTDSWNQTFRWELSQKLNEIAGTNVDSQGRVFGNGVRSNWNGLLHMPGFGMHPTTVPVYDNSMRRADKGLSDTFVEPWHRNLFRAMIRVMFDPRAIEPVRLSLRRGSSSCVPFMTSNDAEKTEIARHGLKHALDAGSLFMKGKYEDAWRDYHQGGAFIVVYRLQSTDKVDVVEGASMSERVVTKDREIAPWLYALTSGKQGKLQIADKSLGYLGGVAQPHMNAMRMRVASGGPSTICYSIMPFAQATRASMYKRFPFSWKATTRADKESKIKMWDTEICADVSDHDQNWPSGWLPDLMCDELLEMGYDERFVELVRTSLRLPYYVGSNARDEGGVLLGDPFDPKGNFGLTSGHPLTDILGTLCMSSVYQLVQIEHAAPWMKDDYKTFGLRAIETTTAYLEGKLDIGCMSKADDAVMLFRNNAVAGGVALHEAMELADKEGKVLHTNPYMIVSYEKGGKYLGDIILHSSAKTLKTAKMTGDIISMIINTHSPEYGVNWQNQKNRSRERRPYPGIGFESRAQVFGSCPMFAEVSEIEESLWRKHSGESYKAYRQALLRHDQEALARDMANTSKEFGFKLRTIGVVDLSPIELSVLAHPEYLHYKYSRDDVRQEVFDLLFAGLPLEEVTPFMSSIHPLFRGM